MIYVLVKHELFTIVRNIPSKEGHDLPASNKFVREIVDEELDTKFDAG